MNCLICNLLARFFPLLWAGVVVCWVKDWDSLRPLSVAAFTGTLIYAIRQNRQQTTDQDPARQLLDALIATPPQVNPSDVADDPPEPLRVVR